ncbi:hypothetical protein QVD17_10078 [Tagetes erecta]|uniref:Uncharacterized protein n=1 Tax=Tagetes erecta TaxID=13708 RepID=A0AAD8P5V9_TARER|nr:hypothetical protein QVD17_10078 [Tagetes erecta]
MDDVSSCDFGGDEVVGESEMVVMDDGGACDAGEPVVAMDNGDACDAGEPVVAVDDGVGGEDDDMLKLSV